MTQRSLERQFGAKTSGARLPASLGAEGRTRSLEKCGAPAGKKTKGRVRLVLKAITTELLLLAWSQHRAALSVY